MQTQFREWLKAKLAERGWKAADLTRASRTPGYLRGLDSGLISRWLREPPFAVVPDNAKTLASLARAFRVPESEVYAAAGLVAPDASRLDIDETDPLEPFFQAANAQMREAVSDVSTVFWPTIIKTQLGQAVSGARAMTQLLAEYDRGAPSRQTPES